MTNNKPDTSADRDTVIVERGIGGGLIAVIALLIALIAILYYLDLLPF
jgi:hypothetical protein